MKFYFNSRQVPSLKDLTLQERFEKIEAATKKLTPPEKVLLNIFKLAVLIPAFVFLLQVVQNWWSIFGATGCLLLFPLLIKPVQLTMVSKYIK